MVGAENKFYVGIEAVFLSPFNKTIPYWTGRIDDQIDFHSEVFNKFFTKIFDNKFKGDLADDCAKSNPYVIASTPTKLEE
jgi:hypothetical protein